MQRRDAKFLARFESLTIEQACGETYRSETYAVYGHGTYPRGSVLEGQASRTHVAGGFQSAADAQKVYPEAQVLDGSTHVPVAQMTSHLPDDDGSGSEADDYRHEGD